MNKLMRAGAVTAGWGILGGLMLGLVGCGSPMPVPQASDQPTVVVMKGQISAWQGKGTVVIPGLPKSVADVQADGSFSLPLPSEMELGTRIRPVDELLKPLKCTGTVQSSDPKAQTYGLMTVEATGSAGKSQVSSSSGSKPGLLKRQVTARVWLYSDRVTKLRGTLNCSALVGLSGLSDLPTVLAVNAKAGWNMTELTVEIKANIVAQLSGSGYLVNVVGVGSTTTFRTAKEFQAQLAF